MLQTFDAPPVCYLFLSRFSKRNLTSRFPFGVRQTLNAPLSTPRHVVDPAHFGQLGIQRLGQLPQLRPVPALPGVA